MKLRPWVKVTLTVIIIALLTYIMVKYGKAAPCCPDLL